jgi:hypothetical protein
MCLSQRRSPAERLTAWMINDERLRSDDRVVAGAT